MGWGTIMSSFLKFKLPLAILIICTAVYIVYLEVEASEDTDEQVSESAVWSPSHDELAQINHACNTNAPGYTQCFIKQMSELGARMTPSVSPGSMRNRTTALWRCWRIFARLIRWTWAMPTSLPHQKPITVGFS